MTPGPPYRAWYSVIRFDDHDPNFFESDAHAVPLPHHSGSRIFRVALTRVAIAARRLSRLTNRCRVARSAASVSPWRPPSATRLIPTFVPSAYRTSSRRLRITSRGVASLVATVVNASVKSVTKSDSFKKSSRSMIPQRAATSVCSARRFSGTFSLPRSGMCQRGSPR
ncbi:MAG: hypothetical protein JWQ95_4503 [Sphaerisporangium sp.]|nr:hypothetical protein [Sphaerisporangium sp.]